ncbi:16S rRNA (uracil(1498)-N(3))-methyltransferase [Clostridium sp. UBA4548]|uniref:16S rRNA (uracil(1498)-N(3))-methyltransferase n=1 Tax=Clostridium sp. UBA4548 TaxID=1946361 RepID=UPI0025BF2A5C|nr:16S rRNA (uracil(1498)-N(3))-methyltransferase [Clostridium sp. UBA4548]
MHKFFILKENIHGDNCIIEGEDVKHIYKVLRLESGDKININDGEGTEYLGEVQDVNKKEVKVKLLEKVELNNESNLKVHLYQGMPKSAKMDLIVQKCTELGISKITPIFTERVVVRSELSEFKKVDRWNRIALEACKQSKRSLIPIINTPIEFEELLQDLKEYDLIIVPYENAQGQGIRYVVNEVRNKKIKDVAIIVGPEGGFEESEIQSFKDLGAYIVTLGPRILRTETAGFTALSLLMYELGDLGGNI